MRIPRAAWSRRAATLLLGAVGWLLASAGPAWAAGGQISGTVTDPASSQAGVGNVQVDVYDSSRTFVTSTVTVGNGSYSVSGLTTGNYEVEFVPTTGNYLGQFYSGQASLGTATPVGVTAGTTTSGIDAALAAGGQISGKVTDASSPGGLLGAEVDVYDAGENFVTSALTLANGTYTLSGLPSGSYEVGFVPPSGSADAPEFHNGKASLAAANPVAVTAGAPPTSGVDAVLPPGGGFSGKVTDANSPGGVGNVEVDVYDSGDAFVTSTQTALDGTYTVSGLFPGNYEVGFVPMSVNDAAQFYNGQGSLASATVIPVAAGSMTFGIGATLAAGGQISGTVTSARSPAGVRNVTVNVYDSSGNPVASAVTGRDGAYTVSGVAPGGYRVGFVPGATYAAQFYSGQATFAAAAVVTVTAGSTTSGIGASLALPALTVVVAGAGSGAVSGSGINCTAGTCAQSYPAGTVVTLTASPAAGSAFTGWSGGGCGGAGSCVVTMNADQTVTATFIALSSLTVSLAGAGSGSVTGSGINCPGACSHTYPSGIAVTLTASPAVGSAFVGWSGGGCGAAVSCTVTVGSSLAVTADFAALPSNRSTPAVSGNATTGQTLTADSGTWSGTLPLAYSYQWQRCSPGCVSIAGATGPSHKLVVADAGARVLVVVTAANAAGRASARSAPVGPVGPSVAQIRASLSVGLIPRGKSARIAAIVRAGGYTVSAKALAAGREQISWYLVPAGAHLTKRRAPKPILVALGKVRFTKTGSARLKVKLTAAGKTKLNPGAATRLNLSAKATFTPSGRSAVRVIKRFGLKR